MRTEFGHVVEALIGCRIDHTDSATLFVSEADV
jgi:hypothetical protein